MTKQEVRDGWIIWEPNFIDSINAHEYLSYFTTELPWLGGKIQVFGKEYEIPRKQVFFADDDLSYSYSGKTLPKSSWDEKVVEIKNSIESNLDDTFNACLANLYRDGNDSNGWHSDNEKELGINPLIASISLGETRRFYLKHNKTKEKISLDLSHGSLLIMGGALQHHWKHHVPKSKKEMRPRVNLTFRKLF